VGRDRTHRHEKPAQKEGIEQDRRKRERTRLQREGVTISHGGAGRWKLRRRQKEKQHVKGPDAGRYMKVHSLELQKGNYKQQLSCQSGPVHMAVKRLPVAAETVNRYCTARARRVEWTKGREKSYRMGFGDRRRFVQECVGSKCKRTFASCTRGDSTAIARSGVPGGVERRGARAARGDNRASQALRESSGPSCAVVHPVRFVTRLLCSAAVRSLRSGGRASAPSICWVSPACRIEVGLGRKFSTALDLLGTGPCSISRTSLLH